MSHIETLFHSSHVFAGNTCRGMDFIADNPYSGFSLCHYVRDDEKHVAQCRASLCKCLGIENEALIVPRQTHGDRIAVIDHLPFESNLLEATDAVITNLKGVAIGVNTADCVPVIIIDDNESIIAAIHAGWRGAIAGIVPKTVDKMKELGASRLKAFIGPSICVKCFEVGEELTKIFPEYAVKRSYGIKPHINLTAFIRHQLDDKEICCPQKSIPCTRCNPEHYFSARAQGINSGRNFSFAILF